MVGEENEGRAIAIVECAWCLTAAWGHLNRHGFPNRRLPHAHDATHAKPHNNDTLQGNSLLSEARRILKEDKGEKGKGKGAGGGLGGRRSEAGRKWEVVREVCMSLPSIPPDANPCHNTNTPQTNKTKQNLLGPDGHTLRANLSGSHKDYKDLIGCVGGHRRVLWVERTGCAH